MGTSYSFKVSETAFWICPVKTNDVKIKTIFSLKVTINLLFPVNPPPPNMKKKNSPSNDLSFPYDKKFGFILAVVYLSVF